MENWKKIEGFEEYEVSSLGRVRRGENILKGLANQGGYLRVGLHRDSQKYMRCIHKLVIRAFIPNPDNKPEGDHINWDLNDNRVENLRWATRSEQAIHTRNRQSKGGIRCIYKRRDKYRVVIVRSGDIVFRKTFSTLQEAIEARDEFLATPTQSKLPEAQNNAPAQSGATRGGQSGRC